MPTLSKSPTYLVGVGPRANPIANHRPFLKGYYRNAYKLHKPQPAPGFSIYERAKSSQASLVLEPPNFPPTKSNLRLITWPHAFTKLTVSDVMTIKRAIIGTNLQ
jgi:hypothetical protein